MVRLLLRMIRRIMMRLGVPPVEWQVVCVRCDRRQESIIRTVIEIHKWATVGDVIDAQVLAGHEVERLKMECVVAWTEVGS